MLFLFVQLVALLFLCSDADAFHNDKAPSFLNEAVRRTYEESCRCSNIVPLLNKLITEFENMAGAVREIQSQTQQIVKDLKLHDQNQKKCVPKVCPWGFEYLPEVDECIKIIFQPLTWTRAGEVCRQVMPGVRLATVTSAAKQQAVERYLRKEFSGGESAACVLPENLWLGAGKSVWTSGQTPDPRRCGGNFLWKTVEGIRMPLNYTNWWPHEPSCSPKDGQVETCLHIMAGRNYMWNDLFCDWPVCPLCEF